MPLLRVNKLSAYYGNIQALKEVSLEVGKGEIVTLIGANGAGKTSTLMAISGILPIRTGSVYFAGKDISGIASHKLVALGVSQVPEGRRIFPELTVKENLDMGAFLRRDKAGIEEDLNELYTLFPRLAERRNQLGGTLSGGEQQMLAISRALMSRPNLLFLDEPSLGLAPLIVQHIFEIIERINRERGTTVLLVEQNAHMALKIANRGYVLKNGQVAMADTAEALLENEEVKRAYLGL